LRGFNVRTMLEMRHISKTFSGVKVLDDVNFVVKKGEIHALVGENGAGKLTLIKILSGAHIRDTGEILIDGKPYTIQNLKDAGNIGIRVIYQEFNLVRTLSIAENIFVS